MMSGLHRASRRAAPPGAWLAFLALAVQVLLPFLVAYEIALASSPAYAESDTFICSASGTHSVPNEHTRHGLSQHCSICMALAASQGFTAAMPVALPLPRGAGRVELYVVSTPRASALAAASYNSRAPPTVS